MEGSTPLMRAAQKGNHKVMQLLIDGNADLFAANTHGKTALEYAKEQRNQKSIEIIKQGEINNISTLRFKAIRKALIQDKKIKETQQSSSESVPVIIGIITEYAKDTYKSTPTEEKCIIA